MVKIKQKTQIKHPDGLLEYFFGNALKITFSQLRSQNFGEIIPNLEFIF